MPCPVNKHGIRILDAPRGRKFAGVLIPVNPFKKPHAKIVYDLDSGECVYCGSKENLTLDHLIPKSKGGETCSDNLVIACGYCNSRKRNGKPFPLKYGRYRDLSA